MVLGDAVDLALAVIAISLAVAAAHWAIFAGAEMRLSLAGAGNVRAAAHAWLRVAPQAGRALEAGDAAAHLPFAADAVVLRVAGRRQQESQAYQASHPEHEHQHKRRPPSLRQRYAGRVEGLTLPLGN
jgi:hypothetical protein